MLIMQMDPFFWGVVIFCLVMFSLMILLVVQGVKRDKKADFEVEATIVDVDMRRGRRGSRSYRPVYEYTYMGDKYRVSSDTKIYASESRVNIGRRTSIKIDPNKPDVIKESLHISDVINNPVIGMYVLGFIITIIALYGTVIKMLLGIE